MNELIFSVSVEEATKIFKSLGKEPFAEVYELIGKLNDQLNIQSSKTLYKEEKKKSNK